MTLIERAPVRGLPGEDMPEFCPVCGRRVIYTYWDTVEGDSRYHLLVCFGDRRRWSVWLRLKVKASEPSGYHYAYRWGPTDNALPVRYDRHTGSRLTE